MNPASDFPRHHQDLGHATHLVDIGLYRPGLAACYVVQHGDELALLDCGTRHSAEQVLATVRALGAAPEQVRWVIPTHVHLDHASGAGQLMAACSNAQLVVHPKGLQHMVDPSKLQAGAIAVYGEAAFQRDFGDLQAIDAFHFVVLPERLGPIPRSKRVVEELHEGPPSTKLDQVVRH